MYILNNPSKIQLLGLTSLNWRPSRGCRPKIPSGHLALAGLQRGAAVLLWEDLQAGWVLHGSGAGLVSARVPVVSLGHSVG